MSLDAKLLEYLKSALAGPRDVTFAPRVLRMLPEILKELERCWAKLEQLQRANRNLSAHQITEEHRQLVLMAIAHLAVERPGWDFCLGELAERLQGRAMYEDFVRLHRDRVPGSAP